MGRQSYLKQRNGVWQFRRRFPADIIREGLVERHYAEWSLGTRDRGEAEKRFAVKLLKYRAIVDEARRQLKESETDLHVVQIEVERPLRPVSSLPKNQQIDLIIEWFVEAERIAEKHRNALLDPSDDEVWDGKGE
ncbi:MAG: DUF6538 domain-containing protein, partial [Verrucomicrobiota bacterium]